MEATGEDVRTVHVCNLKPCFPTAEEIDTKEKQKLLEIFKESFSEDEEFRILSSLPSFNSHGLFSQGRESVAVWERWKLESETKTIVMTASE